MLTNFVGDIKQQMFYQFWKFKLDTLIINHFIIEYNLYDMVTPRILRWVLWRSTMSLFLNVTLYTLIHLWLGIQKSYTNLYYELFYNPSNICWTYMIYRLLMLPWNYFFPCLYLGQNDRSSIIVFSIGPCVSCPMSCDISSRWVSEKSNVCC